MSRYRTIVADPPWNQGGYATHLGGRLVLGRGSSATRRLPYQAMTLEAIRAIRIADYAAESCRLFLWTTNRFLPDAFGVLAAWGFRYRQTLVWHKHVNGSPFTAHIAPNHAEYLLVAVIGTPRRTGRFPSSVLPVPSNCGGGGRRHSAKPDAFQDWIEASSTGPYLEMFARRQRLGWDTWGNEALEHVSLGSGVADDKE
jgi:N6-adenosine-specific RNA methylase IME4